MTAIVGAGTPESVWQAWPALASWPELSLVPVPARVVVVAPHPDDEVLGVGGLLHRLAAHGSEVLVVAVTEGEASHPGSPTLRPEDLAGRRSLERETALGRLGLDAGTVVRVGLPDGRVAGGEDELADRLAALLRPDDWCLTTWRGDGHPDHEATGRASARAAEAAGSRLLEYPIWTWHWAEPDDGRVPWSRARSVRLTPAEQAAKRAAVDEYRTQIAELSADPADAAILPPHILERLLRDNEVVFA